MCDYSLTDSPAESDMPTEQEPWQPVDVSEVEEKMQKLSTSPVEPKEEAAPSSPPVTQGMEADVSEREEVSLKGPLVSASLPDSTQPSHESFEALPAVSSEALPAASSPKPEGKPAAKAPPAGADEKMKEILKLRPFLRFGTDIDSDVAKADFTPPARSPSVPKSSLKPRSKARPASKPPSRAASRGPSRPQTPKRTAKSPERQHEEDAQPKRKKTVGAVSSAYFTGFTPSDLHPSPAYQHDDMPRDLYAVGWKKLFLEWTARDLYKSWSKGTRAFVNMHTALYMYEPSAKYPIAHPRAFAACSLAGDAQLYERFCCWTCRRQVDEGEVKSLWPDMFSFKQHWHVEHASALQTEWTTLALYGGVTVEDLAWEILGVDLEDTPLPLALAALPTIPKVMPHKRGGHNPKIYGPPWYVHQPIAPPPSHPPPSHLLPSLNVQQSDFTFQSSTASLPLLAVNKSLKSLPPSSSTSSHEPAKSEKSVISKAAPSSQRTKVPLPQSSTAPSTAASSQPQKDKPEASEDEPFVMEPGRSPEGWDQIPKLQA